MHTLRYVFIAAIAFTCVTSCSSNIDTRIRQSQAFLEQGHYEAARTELEQLALKYPRDPQIQYLLARAAQGQSNYTDAVIAYENAERNGINPTAEFYLNKGIALFNTGTTGKAESSFEASVSKQPSGEAYRYIGLLRTRHGDYNGAIQAFSQATGLDGDQAALTAYGTALYRIGRNVDALDVLTRAQARTPDDDSLTFMTASANLLNGHYKEAINLYRTIPETSRFYADALYNQGEAYMHIEDSERATTVFKSYLELVPDDHAAIFNLAASLIDSGEYVNAADYLMTLLNDDAYRIRAEYNLGIAYYYLGRIEDAIRFYALAVRHDPDNIRYRYALVLALTDFGDITSAREHIDEIIARVPDNADALAWLSRHTTVGR